MPPHAFLQVQKPSEIRKISLHELIAQRSAINAKIAELTQSQRAEGLAAVRALMAENGLTAADFAAARKPKASQPASVVAKYVNKATGQTWSGRGLKARWLKDAITEGAALESFAV